MEQREVFQITPKDEGKQGQLYQYYESAGGDGMSALQLTINEHDSLFTVTEAILAQINDYIRKPSSMVR